jgi:hypothetical protein
MTGIWLWIWILVMILVTAGPWIAIIYALLTKSAKVRFWICRPLSVLFGLGAVIILFDRSSPNVWELSATAVLFAAWMWWLSGRDPNKSTRFPPP